MGHMTLAHASVVTGLSTQQTTYVTLADLMESEIVTPMKIEAAYRVASVKACSSVASGLSAEEPLCRVPLCEGWSEGCPVDDGLC